MEKVNFGLEIRRMAHLIKRNVHGCDAKSFDASITPLHAQIILFLAEKEATKEVFQKDIEEHFSIRRSTATLLLKSMEKNNLIIRTEVKSDGRLKKISLTDKAKSIQQDMRENFKKLEDKVTHNLSDEEKNQFIAIIKKMQKNLE